MTDTIQYIGEHLWPGQVGQVMIPLSFVSAILAVVAYAMATNRASLPEAAGWLKLGRIAFVVQGAAIFTTIGLIFYVMINQYYEYQYVQAHVNADLEFRYIFSAFWEGQEGSFLLWMFWHVVLGLLLIASAREWEAPVLAVLASVQVVLVSMILGIYVGWGDDPMRLGSNPLLLLRDVMDAPIFGQADYVSLLEGTGLNPLLQNYWMTIHPPTLFLGFASTTVPFAFAVAGLWTGRHREWIRPVLPWALMSGAILGAGILMGGAWAYEALSFGGYWAWDPVENMSLVPWLVLLAGIHTNLVAKNTEHSTRATYAFYLLSFLLILYSTFMTRSGILGETSVHAFTEMGLETQLVGFILIFGLLALGLMIWRYRDIPAPSQEEATGSKEFWMFIGSLVLLFSAILITGSTSLPVYNKIRAAFDPSFVGSVITDPIPHYNKYQLWIGVFIGLISGFSQYLRFRESRFASYQKRFWLRTALTMVLTAGLTVLTTQWINATAWQYWLLLFTGWFTLLTNLDYLVFFLRGNLKLGGSALSHIGFGAMVIGILASGLNKQVISRNPFLMEGLTAEENEKRQTILIIKNTPVVMGPYEITYLRDTLDGLTRTYTIQYKRRDPEGKVIETFELTPNVLYDKTFTKIAAPNPSTKHYWNRDIFTHIAGLPEEEMNIEAKRAKEDSLNYRVFDLAVGDSLSFLDTVPIKTPDTFLIRRFTAQVLEITRQPTHPEYQPQPADLAVGVRLAISSTEDNKTYEAAPMLVLRDELLYTYPVQLNEINTRVKLDEGIFEQLIQPEESLDYQEFRLREGDSTSIGGHTVRFVGYNKSPKHPYYQPEADDIAVGAVLEVASQNGPTYRAEPVFLIRNTRPLNIKDEIPDLGIHTRFVSLDPATGQAAIYLAYRQPETLRAPVAIATKAYRSDWVALQAIEFPGINLFWIGSSLMMLGLTLSMFHRIGKVRHAD